MRKEIVNIKDHKGNYKKLIVTDKKIFLDKMEFEYSLKKLVAIISLYGLLLTRPYNKINGIERGKLKNE